MPGWHAKVEDQVAAGELQEFIIATEQYSERMALFLQWKKMSEVPAVVDPLNVLAVKAVPILLLVDEYGTIRYRNPSDDDLATFLAENYLKPAKKRTPLAASPLLTDALAALSNEDAKLLPSAIESYRSHLTENRKDAPAAFQLGVLLRHRYDSMQRQRGDFQEAVESWSQALAEVPSQYIWRRRIQQYGPQLDKPYPFYNWVLTAREEISERGETPLPLATEPSGSEFAKPATEITQPASEIPYPAKNGLVSTDENAVQIETTLIPHTSAEGKGESVRLHVSLTPNDSYHWTSDAQDASLWLLTDNAQPQLLSTEITRLPANAEVSHQPRALESNLETAVLKNPRLALFYFICSDEPPVCTFLQSEVALELPDT